MKPSVHTIFARQDDQRAIREFLRQIPEGEQFRFELTLGHAFQKEGYARAPMTGYYLYADGQMAQCLVVTNIFAYQHLMIAAYHNAHDRSMQQLKEDVERLLGVGLAPDRSLIAETFTEP